MFGSIAVPEKDFGNKNMNAKYERDKGHGFHNADRRVHGIRLQGDAGREEA